MAIYIVKMGVWNDSQTMCDSFQTLVFNGENLPFYVSETLAAYADLCLHMQCVACVHKHEPAYAILKHAYTSMSLCTQVGFQKHKKCKFFALILRFGTNLISFRSRFKPLFSQYKQPYMVPFQNTQKILRENLRFNRNSESKREFFTKHP